MRKSGFTLVELIVVIAIIAVLAAVVAPNALRSIERARQSGTQEDFNSVKTASTAYFSDLGVYPASCATAALCGPDFISGNGAATWDGPYLEKWPVGGRWAGSAVSFFNASAALFGAAAAQEVWIGVTSVPAVAQARIDTAMDNGNGNASGYVRTVVTGGVTYMGILIFRNGVVN
jgi:general secretion pathway protein G